MNEIKIPDINYKEEIKKCKTMENIAGKNGLLQRLPKDVIQNMLEAEMEDLLGREKYQRRGNEQDNKNYRNGYSKKGIKRSVGNVNVDIPRDRNADFEPRVVKKYETVCNELDKKVIGLYARGMSTRDIQSELEEFYMVLMYQ